MIKNIFLAGAIIFGVSAGTAFADDLSEVEALMERKVDAVISVLHDKESTEIDRRRKILNSVNSIFDFNLMARLSLGKKYWLELSKEDQLKFTDLFVKRIQNSYLDKMGLYSDEKVNYEHARWVKKRIQFQTYLVSNENKISVLYKLYKAKNSWKVYDLEIQGVSFIQTFRKQFEGVLKTGTMAELFKKLEAPDPFSVETPKKKSARK